MRRTFSTASALALSLAACVGTIGDDGTDGTGDERQPLACADAAPDVAFTPMRRLTRREYNYAVLDLFGDDTHPADGFIPDEHVAGFAANAVAPVTKLQVSDYQTAAETVAASLVHERPEALGCDAAEPSCAEFALDRLAPRMFRQELTDEARTLYLGVYDDGNQWGAKKALELMVQAMLMDPAFLYQVELTGVEGTDSVVPLNGYEVAGRLALFLWQSVPDEALLDAAKRGELDRPEGIAQQASRMLGDEKAQRVTASFFGQYLEIEHLEDAIRDDGLYPTWSPSLAQSMKRETYAFVDDVVREGGNLRDLLSASYSFVDDELAELYGVETPTEPYDRVELDPSERAGLLTMPSFLTSHAHAEDPSWVERGLFIREQLLCTMLPPPPPGVDMNMSNDPDRLTNPECQNCHILMDPIGIGFDGYDALGRHAPGDEPAIELNSAGDLSGTYQNPVKLAQTLADAPQVRRCMATHWLRFATRREEAEADHCSLSNIDEGFESSDLDMEALLIRITQSDAFRHRRTTL